MRRRLLSWAVLLAMGLVVWTRPAAAQQSSTTGQASDNASPAGAADKAVTAGQSAGTSYFGDAAARASADPANWCQPTFSQFDARFGWWAMSRTGSPQKTGYYQDLHSSPFWDVDGMASDGCRTVAVQATGDDNIANDAHAYYYRPNASASVDYEQYLHELQHDPLNNMTDVTDPSVTSTAADPKVIKQDLGGGDNYSMRVQELKASIKGIVTDNLRIRLDVWGMERDGFRQVDAVAMCYNSPDGTYPSGLPPDHLGPGGAPLGPLGARRCHVLSMPQQIDWISREIKPVIEFHPTDNLTLEYSRPMRGFTADDGSTDRFYDRTGIIQYGSTTQYPPGNPNNLNPYPFAVVPSNYTQMDQLKISWKEWEDTKVYSYLMIGNTENEEIAMMRYFNNMDIRVTNTTLPNVTLTGYGRVANEDEQLPNLANLPQEDLLAPAGTLVQPIDYHDSTAGLKGVWRPGGGGYGLGGLAVAAGYEYQDLDRLNAIYPATGTPVINESHTITNSIQVSPTLRWSPCLDVYLRYKYQDCNQPLIGFKPDNDTYNTILPQVDNVVEIGGTWHPSACFMFNACFGVENSWNHSQYANFDEQNYPFNVNFWWRLTEKLSLSGGYAIYSNFLGQNITVGDEATTTATSVAPVTGRWNYNGGAQVWNLASCYQIRPKVRLTAEFEYVHGADLVSSALMNFPSGAVTDLGSYGQVVNDSSHVRVGVDWTLTHRWTTFYRYEFYDFSDIQPGYQSGTAQGVLGGVAGTF